MQNITLKCTQSLATDSLDTIHPLGARQDNSGNHLFNDKLYRLYGFKQIAILDIGCAGGRFVRETIDDGHIAVGLDGSDYSKREGRAEWRTIPEYLFTCNVTKPFQLFSNGKPMFFNAITAWEFMEHIEERDLDQLIKNITKHMATDCILIMSICNEPCIYQGRDYHVTKKPKGWWLNKFEGYGLVPKNKYLQYFGTQFVRGKYETEHNFHLVLARTSTILPEIPKVSISHKLWERWVGSNTQINLRKVLVGK